MHELGGIASVLLMTPWLYAFYWIGRIDGKEKADKAWLQSPVPYREIHHYNQDIKEYQRQLVITPDEIYSHRNPRLLEHKEHELRHAIGMDIGNMVDVRELRDEQTGGKVLAAVIKIVE